jgi:hypothetical protein
MKSASTPDNSPSRYIHSDRISLIALAVLLLIVCLACIAIVVLARPMIIGLQASTRPKPTPTTTTVEPDTIPTATKPSQPFIGRWLTTDVDGSNKELTITRSDWSEGRLLNLYGSDDRTAEFWCGGHARMEAIGLAEGNSLTTSGAWWCLDREEKVLFPNSGELTYDPVTDTIVEDAGEGYPPLIWHRHP